MPDISSGNSQVHVAGPVEFRDADKALPLAQKAAQLSDNKAAAERVLGMVYYRLKQSQQAVDALRHSVETRKGGPISHELLFLAMAYHQNGQASEARETYDQGMLKWRAIKSPDPVLAREMKLLLDEIEPLLGIKSKPD